MRVVGDGSFRDGQIVTSPVEKTIKKDKARSEHVEKSAAPEEGSGPFAKILRGLGREVDREEAMGRRGMGGGANGGQEMGNVELLALQAGVYRYSEAVDLSAKLVDRAASAVKTVLQGQ